MARLAIAKGFLGEYAKLDKDVQSAVDAAIATFAQAPSPRPAPGEAAAQPGRPDPPHAGGQPLARHRPRPRDRERRGRPRADRDTYCLVTVLPQDKANAYAASSASTGARILEVRDEEAIQNLRHRGTSGQNCSPTSATPTWPGSASTRSSCRRSLRQKPTWKHPGSLPRPSTPRCTRWPAA